MLSRSSVESRETMRAEATSFWNVPFDSRLTGCRSISCVLVANPLPHHRIATANESARDVTGYWRVSNSECRYKQSRGGRRVGVACAGESGSK